MRALRFPSLLLLMLLTAACTSSTTPVTSPSAPEIHIEQLPASAFDVQQQGATSVAYKMTVRNRAADAITLKKLEMKTVGRSPYSLRNTPATFDETIAPGEEKVVTFSMWAYPNEGQAKSDTVWVEGVATFDRTQVAFSQSFKRPAS